MPVCADCVSFRFSPYPGQRPVCARKAEFDPVFGEVRHEVPALRERSNSWFGADRCGPDAQYFERRVMTPPSGGSAIARPPP